MSATSFYEPLGDGRFRATEHTVGSWDPGSQHGGPPAALLARAIETESVSWPATLARVTVDILMPIPVADVTVVHARGWRIRQAEHVLPSDCGEAAAPTVPGFPARAELPWQLGTAGGYFDAMEWRRAGGKWQETGPAAIWGRMRFPLLPDEEPSGLQRVLTIADSGNGISAVLPFARWIFVNTELTVHLAAVPSGEWVCLDARTQVDRRGFGLASSLLFDRERLVAHGAQTLYVAPR